MSERIAIMAGQFVKQQFVEAGEGKTELPHHDPRVVQLFDMAGGGLSARWVERLADGFVGKVTIRQLIGLRRLTQEPIDTIIGLEYTHPANRGRMAGLKRIRHELGEYKPKTKKYLCELAGCTYPIISRIEQFSTWAVINNAADMETPAVEVDRALRETFSIDVLVRLKYAIHSNIDDIVGLGEYDDEAAFLVGKGAAIDYNNKEVPDSDIMSAEDMEARAKDMLAQFAASKAASKPTSDAVTGFRPKVAE